MARQRHEKTAHELGLPSFRYKQTPDGDREIWVNLPLGEWEAQARVEAQDGQPVVAELRVAPWRHWKAECSPATPAGGLTARELRRLRLGEALAAAHEKIDFLLGRDAHPESVLNIEPLGFERGKLGKPAGRAPRSDDYYATVAMAYVDAVRAGSRSPVADAAQALGGFDRTYVRDLLSEARRRELLSRPPKGRAGGELTDKGREALKGDT